MREIQDMNLLSYYVKKHNIMECFESDMTPYMKLYEYSNGEDILIAGDKMTDFYFIVDGRAKIFNTLENGKMLLLRFSRPLSDLGSVELLEDDRIVKSCVQALHGVKAIVISFADMEKYAIDDVTFLKYCVKNLSQKLFTLSNSASINLMYPIENRFASYLVTIFSYEMQAENSNRIDEIKATKTTELATFLGVSYRHLNRVIKSFEEQGIIERTKGGFKILDYHRLEALSGGMYE